MRNLYFSEALALLSTFGEQGFLFLFLLTERLSSEEAGSKLTISISGSVSLAIKQRRMRQAIESDSKDQMSEICLFIQF